MVIGARPLIDVVPLQQKGSDQEVVTQLGMHDVVELGLLKMDFLGLRNLDVIDKAVELAGGLDIGTLPLDDGATYAMLAAGESTGVFQFESSGMREALRLVKPTEFEDLIALVALYRPGPMGYISTYAARKHGKEQVAFSDPRLEAITGGTYAICIYQEQYMEIAKQLAGFSPAEAETLRKAIGKKIHSLMASLKDKFLEGCAQNDVAAGVAQQLWKDMESSQDYSFNKAHAACYALIAYRTAWLKANHPREYMAALISSVMNTKDRVPFYVNACREMGIEVLPPDVNSSHARLRDRGGEDPLRAERGEERRRVGRGRDRPRARGRRAVRVALGIRRARRSAGAQPAGAGVSRQVRSTRLDRRDADGNAGRVPRQRAGLGQKHAADRLGGPSLDLRRAIGEAVRRPGRDTIRRSRPPSSTSGSCCGWRRRRSGSTSPSTRSRRSSPSSGGRRTAPSRTSSAGATVRSSSWEGSSPASSS